jgi:hypothetical protein
MITGVTVTVIMTELVLTLSMRNELKRFGNSGEESSVLKVSLIRERGQVHCTVWETGIVAKWLLPPSLTHSQ